MTWLYLFYGIISEAYKQNLFIWLFILVHIWVFVYFQLSGDLKSVDLMQKAMYLRRGQAADFERLGNLETCINFLECTQWASDLMKAKLPECYLKEKENSSSILCVIGSDHVSWTLLLLIEGLCLIVLLCFSAACWIFVFMLESCMGNTSKTVF